MKITHTDLYRFSIKMRPFTIATGTMDFAQNVFIRVHTDAGIYGVGECSAFPVIVGETQETCLAMGKDFAALWKGRNPLEIEERNNDLHKYTAHNFTIKSAFDMALYDIASKHAGLPLYKFLNGQKREVETDITIGIGTIEEMVKQAIEFKGSGARILKVKLGKNAEHDIQRLTEIREAVGPDIILRIDANQGWGFEDAIKALTSMSDLDIQFCEQPMSAWYDDLLPALRKISPIKIMADESCFNHHDARKLINDNACDYINIKFSKSGGITESLKIYETASKFDIPCMIGGMLESRIALSAKLHFAYACPQIRFYDLDTCMIGHLEDPCKDGVKYHGYLMDIGDHPGIGADANEEFLKGCERFTV
ncbi:mandelate racemase/muconate lactonizing enzyme family protein [Paradesertivirga mongoliensis]|uniref:Dipeptide epimerase n=1 Tax=Paradesertivirga mongoliensis TaxID=2100740 RepID=A0ABW4ZPF4_9SPHI|nr:dipeptide epimerase [Pedobacter mongoliensis]